MSGQDSVRKGENCKCTNARTAEGQYNLVVHCTKIITKMRGMTNVPTGEKKEKKIVRDRTIAYQVSLPLLRCFPMNWRSTWSLATPFQVSSPSRSIHHSNPPFELRRRNRAEQKSLSFFIFLYNCSISSQTR